MAEQANVTAPFPTPPPFYRHFTKENIARLRQLQKSEQATEGSKEIESTGLANVNLSNIPQELRYLLPPEPPRDDKYRSFGVDVDLHAPDPDLAAAQIEQLYPDHLSVRLNPQPHLIALARSLLTTFLSLTGILSQNPLLYQDRAQDLQTIMYNMHDLINHYRPHQARETLILMMEERVEKMRGEVRAVEESKEKVAKLLQGLREVGVTEARQTEIPEDKVDPPKDGATNARRVRQRAAWSALAKELG